VPLSRNLGTLTFWKPLGHSRPVTGLKKNNSNNKIVNLATSLLIFIVPEMKMLWKSSLSPLLTKKERIITIIIIIITII